jgi:hypothetical protein
MKYDSIVGGIEYSDNVQTIVSGGKEIVVGETIKKALRDRILYFKYVGDDTKKILDIINISKPVIFGNVEYDDGNKKIISKKESLDSALMTILENRLHEKPELIVNRIIHEYGLREYLKNAMLDMIKILILEIKNKNGTMKKIKVGADVGEILTRIENGREYFKIDTKGKDIPTDMPEIINILLNILKTKYKGLYTWKINKHESVWPDMDSSLKDAVEKSGKDKNCKNIKEYVKEIIKREHILLEYLDKVENYYLETARCIKKYTDDLQLFFLSIKK